MVRVSCLSRGIFMTMMDPGRRYISLTARRSYRLRRFYFMITLGSQVAIPGTSVIKTVMAI